MSDTSNALVKIVEASGLEQAKQDYLLEKFADYTAIAALWSDKARSIVVTDEGQKDLMKQAREGRLLLKDKRVDIERTRKAMKDSSLKEGRAIDDIAKALTALIEPTEKYLDEQEKFAERKEGERRIILRSERLEQSKPYMEFLPVGTMDWGGMSQNDFDKLLNGAKLQFEAQVSAQKKVEEDRIAKEKADAEQRESQRIENERLKAEAAIKEKELAEERSRVEEDRKVAEQKARKEREEVESKAKKEREAIEKKLKEEKDAADKLKKELIERQVLEEGRKQQAQDELNRIAEEQRQSELAPDKQKLLALADSITTLKFPEVKSKKAKALLLDLRDELDKLATQIRNNAKNL